MGIIGAHVLLYTREADALRGTLRDVFGFKSVDAGGGWLIFELPPSELGVHPAEGPTYESGVRHQLSLMCDDVHALIAEMTKSNVVCSPIDEQRWGSITRITLPGGGKLGIYQPKHPSPLTSRRD